MKRIALFNVSLLLAAYAAMANPLPPCVPGTLAQYIAQGSCTTDLGLIDVTFSASSFQPSGTQAGLLTAADITVTPVGAGDRQAGFRFQAPQFLADAGFNASYAFSYVVNAPFNVLASDLAVANAGNDCSPGCGGLASYTVTEDIDSAPTLQISSTGIGMSALQSTNAPLGSGQTFTVSNIVNLSASSFTLGLQTYNGTAYLGDNLGNDGSVQTILTYAPEPASAWLMGAGLLALVIGTKRRSWRRR